MRRSIVRARKTNRFVRVTCISNARKFCAAAANAMPNGNPDTFRNIRQPGIVLDRKVDIKPQVDPYEGLSGGEVIFKCLAENDVKHAFGYSGGAVLPLLDAFHSDSIRFVMNRHEQCSGHAAEAYSKASGLPGVVVVTSGPGLTNVVTPLLDSLNDGVPIIVFSGQVPTSAVGTDAFQEAPAVELTRPATKWSYQLRNIEEIPEVVSRAFKIAMSGRKGPVHIDVPKDISSGKYDPSKRRLTWPHLAQVPVQPQEENQKDKIGHLIALLQIAKRPVIYVGQGAIECQNELTEFAERWNIPVTTTLHGMGIFDELHPLSMQMVGMHGHAGANFAIQNCDLLLAIGSRFDDRTTGVVSKYAPAARQAELEGRGGIVHFDISPNQMGKIVQPTLSLLGDCKKFLRQILDYGKPLRVGSDPAWVDQCQRWQTEHPFRVPPSVNGRMPPQRVVQEIDNQTQDKENYLFTTGVGSHQMYACQFIKWRRPRTIMSSGSLGTMGVSTPFSIGAAIARPKETVISIDGDGSFMMTAIDIMTIAEQNLKVKICILNDAQQNMVVNWQKLYCDGRVTATLNLNPDFKLMAESCGIKGIECDNEEDLPGAVEEMLSHPGPVVCNFKVQPSMCIPMVAPGKALDDMILYDEWLSRFNDDTRFEGEAPS